MLSNKFTGGMLSLAAEMLPACPDLMTVKRAKVTQGAMGGTSYDWVSADIIASSVPCNIQNVGPMERDTFSRRGIKVSNKIFDPQGLPIRLGDRIVNPNDATQIFVVTFISDMGGEHSAFKIYVDLVQ